MNELEFKAKYEDKSSYINGLKMTFLYNGTVRFSHVNDDKWNESDHKWRREGYDLFIQMPWQDAPYKVDYHDNIQEIYCLDSEKSKVIIWKGDSYGALKVIIFLSFIINATGLFLVSPGESLGDKFIFKLLNNLPISDYTNEKTIDAMAIITFVAFVGSILVILYREIYSYRERNKYKKRFNVT